MEKNSLAYNTPFGLVFSKKPDIKKFMQIETLISDLHKHSIHV